LDLALKVEEIVFVFAVFLDLNDEIFDIRGPLLLLLLLLLSLGLLAFVFAARVGVLARLVDISKPTFIDSSSGLLSTHGHLLFCPLLTG
jgi:hypothetical protein